MNSDSAHSVRRHLRVPIDAYDAAIRQFIPGYEAMLGVASRELAAVAPGLVLDLGGGTGALAEAILKSRDSGTVELIDVDPEMLAQARTRLARFGGRVRFTEQSFFAALPRCNGAAASLALHHVRTLDAKRALYRRIHGALEPGGVFINADATMPADPDASEATWRAWGGVTWWCRGSTRSARSGTSRSGPRKTPTFRSRTSWRPLRQPVSTPSASGARWE